MQLAVEEKRSMLTPPAEAKFATVVIMTATRASAIIMFVEEIVIVILFSF